MVQEPLARNSAASSSAKATSRWAIRMLCMGLLPLCEHIVRAIRSLHHAPRGGPGATRWDGLRRHAARHLGRAGHREDGADGAWPDRVVEVATARTRGDHGCAPPYPWGWFSSISNSSDQRTLLSPGWAVDDQAKIHAACCAAKSIANPGRDRKSVV